jgi:methionyl-tRNA formyltransferase
MKVHGKSEGGRDLKVLFMGNGLPAILCLRLLKTEVRHSDILVVTPPGGRLHAWNLSLRDYCVKSGIRHISPKDVNSRTTLAVFKRFEPDVIFSVYYSQVLSAAILGLARHAINFHPSLLPKYRGTAPIVWAIVNGEKRTGVTAHEMTHPVDSGRIYSTMAFPIGPQDTGYLVYKKAARTCVRVFRRVLNDLRDNSLKGRRPAGEGSYHSSKTPRVNLLDPLTQDKLKVYNIVRALSRPLPNAYWIDGKTKYVINRVRLKVDGKTAKLLRRMHIPGEVLYRLEGGRFMLTSNGFLRIEDYSITHRSDKTA